MPYNYDFTDKINTILENDKEFFIHWTTRTSLLMLNQPHQARMYIAQKAADQAVAIFKQKNKTIFKNKSKLKPVLWETLSFTLIEGLTLHYSESFVETMFNRYHVDFAYNYYRKNRTIIPKESFVKLLQELLDFHKEIFKNDNNPLIPQEKTIEKNLAIYVIKYTNRIPHYILLVLSIINLLWPSHKLISSLWHDYILSDEVYNWSANEYLQGLSNTFTIYYIASLILMIYFIFIAVEIDSNNSKKLENVLFQLKNIELDDDLKQQVHKNSIPTFFPIAPALLADLPKLNTLAKTQITEAETTTKIFIEPLQPKLKQAIIYSEKLEKAPIKEKEPSTNEILAGYKAIGNTKKPNSAFLFYDKKKIKEQIDDKILRKKYKAMAQLPRLVGSTNQDGIVLRTQLTQPYPKGPVQWSTMELKACKSDQRIPLQLVKETKTENGEVIRFYVAERVVTHKEQQRSHAISQQLKKR